MHVLRVEVTTAERRDEAFVVEPPARHRSVNPYIRPEKSAGTASHGELCKPALGKLVNVADGKLRTLVVEAVQPRNIERKRVRGTGIEIDAQVFAMGIVEVFRDVVVNSTAIDRVLAGRNPDTIEHEQPQKTAEY